MYINRIALALNSAFYNLQPKSGGGGKCLRKDVLPFIPVVEAHEGRNLELNSHAETFKRKLNELVPQKTEPVVVNGNEDLIDKTGIAAQASIDEAKLAAKDVAEGGTVPSSTVPLPFQILLKGAPCTHTTRCYKGPVLSELRSALCCPSPLPGCLQPCLRHKPLRQIHPAVRRPY